MKEKIPRIIDHVNGYSVIGLDISGIRAGVGVLWCVGGVVSLLDYFQLTCSLGDDWFSFGDKIFCEVMRRGYGMIRLISYEKVPPRGFYTIQGAMVLYPLVGYFNLKHQFPCIGITSSRVKSFAGVNWKSSKGDKKQEVIDFVEGAFGELDTESFFKGRFRKHLTRKDVKSDVCDAVVLGLIGVGVCEFMDSGGNFGSAFFERFFNVRKLYLKGKLFEDNLYIRRLKPYGEEEKGN